MTRVSIQLEKFANGQVFFPREAPWLAELENELFAFPNGRHDDQVDAIIQALAYQPAIFLYSGYSNASPNPLIYNLWLQQMRGF